MPLFHSTCPSAVACAPHYSDALPCTYHAGEASLGGALYTRACPAFTASLPEFISGCAVGLFLLCFCLILTAICSPAPALTAQLPQALW